MKIKQNSYVWWIAATIVVIVGFLLNSGNTPFLKMNVWDDTNGMLSVGNAWLHGMIPYRDIFEQRGPVLFFIYMIAAALPGNNYFGIFILEVLNVLILLMVFRKIGRTIYPEWSRVADFATALSFATLLFVSRAYQLGGAPEEFMLVPLSVAVLVSVRVLYKAPISKWLWTVLGISFGIVFWTKFTIVGTFIALFLVAALFMRGFKKWIIAGFFTGLGYSIISAFVVIYFKLNHGLYMLYRIYFEMNMTAYQVKFDDAMDHVFASFNVIYSTFGYAFLWVIPYFFTIKSVKAQDKNKLGVISLFGFISTTFAMSYGVKIFPYGLLAMLPIVMLQIILIVGAIKFSTHSTLLKFAVPVAVMLLAVPPLANQNKDLYEETYTRGLGPIAKYIEKQKGEKTLLEPSFLDSGLFNLADIVPSTYYFDRINVTRQKYPEMYDGLWDTISNQRTRYVLISHKTDWTTKGNPSLKAEKKWLHGLDFDYLKYYKVAYYQPHSAYVLLERR